MQSKQTSKNADPYIVVIGASLGGIEALAALLSQLADSFPAPILAVLHLHPNSPAILDRLLSAKTDLKVTFAQHEDLIQAGKVYLAPPDRHLLIKGGQTLLSQGPRENRSRPAIDTLFRSAAVDCNARAIGVLLTGLLDDGAAGLQAVKECGGVAVVQDPADAQYAEMPENAIELGNIDHIAPLAEMGSLLMRLVAQPLPVPASVPEHLRREVEIAQGQSSPDLDDNIIGELAPIVCPDCGGTLSEVPSGNGSRYRCHEGHAFSRHSLLNAQFSKMEYSLWAAVRVLEEQANMLAKLGRRESKTPYRSGSPGSIYQARAQEIRDHAGQIRNFLLHPTEKTV
jgi:two-component system, chemotaxis family, protein-glutamate methylesterase/glutaminase